MHRVHSRYAKLMAHWIVILALLLVIVGASVWLWHFHALRPYITGFGTALAAFLAPLPGILTPETRGKWLIAVGISGVIGLGTWFGSDYLQKEKDRIEGERDRLIESSHFLDEFFTTTIKSLPNEEQSKFLVSSGHRLNQLFVQRQVAAMFDLASVVTEIDHGNGHALYFSGEVHRGLGHQTDMRGAFQHYLAAAASHPEALLGDYRACYENPSGFCGERTAWIKHLMAHDYYQDSLKFSGVREADGLRTALMYEHGAMRLQASGFKRDGALESSCELLQGIAERLRTLGQTTIDVDSIVQRHRAPSGPC